MEPETCARRFSRTATSPPNLTSANSWTSMYPRQHHADMMAVPLRWLAKGCREYMSAWRETMHWMLASPPEVGRRFSHMPGCFCPRWLCAARPCAATALFVWGTRRSTTSRHLDGVSPVAAQKDAVVVLLPQNECPPPSENPTVDPLFDRTLKGTLEYKGVHQNPVRNNKAHILARNA